MDPYAALSAPLPALAAEQEASNVTWFILAAVVLTVLAALLAYSMMRNRRRGQEIRDYLAANPPEIDDDPRFQR